MLKDDPGAFEHEKFKRLCALAASSSLAPLELSELEAHLQRCDDCHDVLLQYHTLSTFGMSSLADGYLEPYGPPAWNEAPVRRLVLQRVQGAPPLAGTEKLSRFALLRNWRWHAVRPAVAAALAACLLLAVGFGAYHLGVHARGDVRTAPLASFSVAPLDPGLQKLSEEKRAAEETLAAQGKKLELLQAESADKERELLKLRAALSALQEHANQLTAASTQSQAQSQSQLQALAQQRDALTAQLQAVSQSYDSQRSELASLRAERDRTALRTTTLEAKIADLTAANTDQERRLKDAEQYLSSDRDIRELMGARKLYIADVFDVDGSSRTQRPFGRVFYTQGKSLIFYAFDLDREPGVINASTFQVWGQREAPQGEQAAPMNLGILYKDNDTNRRWVMRFDEPKQLAEIDAVFVTVEPRGGSHKPTSKPFLYALLRNEANHP
jgi:hypothetical protein